tara:strand:+ start:3180 stop:3950 length:771 start_codon:yes stop_codon:yes gene_type:complete
MKIAVLLKQVPGSESSLPINESNDWIDESSITYVMNPPDNFALEEALIIKEKIGTGEVVVVSMGPSRVQKVIREGLAKGADRGIHIQEDENIETDPLVISERFTDALKSENFDLILTGLQSDDTGMGQTGVLVGEMLGLSTATLVIETDLKQDKIRVKRELESGWFQWVELPLPASISIQSGLNNPRYPSLKGIMSAKKKEIKSVSYSSLTSGTQVQGIDKIFVPTASKQTEVIEGELDHVVGRIVDIMRSEVKVI